MIVNYHKKKKELSQRNDFVRKSIYEKLSVNDLKLFKLIVSKIENNSTLFKDFYTLTYDELNFLGITKNDRFKIVSDSLKNLANFYITISKNDIEFELGIIKNKFGYEKYSGKILVSIDEDLTEYLLNLKSQYLKYDIENIIKLKTKYEIKLYEYLKSYTSNFNTIELTIEELKTILEIDLNEYSLYGNFKQRILDKTIKRLNDNTDLYIVYLEKKYNKKVVSVRFLFEAKSK